VSKWPRRHTSSLSRTSGIADGDQLALHPGHSLGDIVVDDGRVIQLNHGWLQLSAGVSGPG
jgi:hypothetical protein